MAAVIGLALVEMAVFVVGTVAVIAGGRDWFHWFLVMLLWNGLSSTATVLGGAIVRTCRPAAVSRHAAA